MSHIPNSAMPHAAPSEGTKEQSNEGGSGILSRATETITETARQYPKTAIAAGVAVAAGAVAAAAIPLVRGRGGSEEKASGGSKKSGGSKSGGGKS